RSTPCATFRAVGAFSGLVFHFVASLCRSSNPPFRSGRSAVRKESTAVDHQANQAASFYRHI
ncbi:MAG: hypothetical protein ACYTX0_50835, partial [Nostoc sp.]